MDQPIFLSINRAVIGDWRAAQVFMVCRAYAHHVSPGCDILAKYVNHERVGWRFWLHSPEAEEMLFDFYSKIMAAAP